MHESFFVFGALPSCVLGGQTGTVHSLPVNEPAVGVVRLASAHGVQGADVLNMYVPATQISQTKGLDAPVGSP